MYAATSEGFFTTSDGWMTVDTILLPTDTWRTRFINDVKFKPGQPDSVYFCDAISIMVYKANLQEVDTLFSTTIISTNFRMKLETITTAPDYLYAIHGQSNPSNNNTPNNGFRGFYLSTNAGQSFDTKSTSPNILGRDTTQVGDLASQATYDLAITANPSNPAEVIIGGIYVWTSADTGTNWICNSYHRRNTLLNYIHADIHELEYNNGELFACTDGGVVRSTNDAASWLEISSGLGISQLYDIDISSQTINNTYGGLQDNGLHRFLPNKTMDHVKPGDGVRVLVNPNDDDTLVLVRDKGRVDVSYNGGIDFTYVSNWSPVSNWVCPIIMDPAKPQQIHIGVDTDLRYTNNTFQSSTIVRRSFNNNIRRIEQGINNTDKMYVSTSSDLYRIDNVYSTFDTTNISDNLPFIIDTAFITGIAIDPNSWERAWLSLSGFVDGIKVYETTDGGDNWTNISDNIPNVPVNCITYEAGSSDGLYIGTDIGVFYRDDNLGHWIYFTNGLPTTVVNDLEIAYGKIRAATYGRGVWESDLYVSCPTTYTLIPGTDPGDPDFTGIQRYEASNWITSTRIITGGYGSDVKYQVGEVVILRPGFHAKSANLFEAKTAPCGSQTNSTVILPVSGRLIIN